MADAMQFPESWHQFLHDYEFRDSLAEYTNNSMLIPSFRVEQMIEHYFCDAVPVVRCRDCKFWMPEHIERDDGSIMLYEQLPRMKPGMAPIEFGVNVGSYCTLCENVITHGFRDGNPSLDCTRLWRREDDYCSRGQRRDQSADVRNMGQFAGDGKTGGPNDADQH